MNFDNKNENQTMKNIRKNAKKEDENIYEIWFYI